MFFHQTMEAQSDGPTTIWIIIKE